MSSTSHLPAWMEPEARKPAGQEELKAPNGTTPVPYAKPIPTRTATGARGDAGSGAPMQITWYYWLRAKAAR